MSMFEEKNLLPGVTTEVELSFNEDYDTSLWGTTESVIIVGTAFDGPVNKPVKLYSPEYAKFVFGDAYNPISKKEGTLVKEFLDTWDKGCRTIWGVRVSGKPLYKDFQLSTTDEYKLRVSSTFPSNDNKNCYFTYDNAVGRSKITIYKPKNKTTMTEKSSGIVDITKPMIDFDINLENYDIGPDTPIGEFINKFNSARRNNVLTLSLIDKAGDDVTSRMDIVGTIPVKAIFPGAYFIGRDKNTCYASTDLRYELETETDEFGNDRKIVVKDLIINSDIKSNLPIFAKELKLLNRSFIDAGVIMTEMFDFLNNYQMVNKVFQIDETDYEEVDLSDFDLYQKLGNGYAVTAVAETRGSSKDGKADIKVVEAKLNDPARVIPIKDGVYSTIENLDTDYRVLASGNADAIIRNRIPRKSDFRKAKPEEVTVFNNKAKLTTKVDPDNIKGQRKYKFVLDAFDSETDITKEILKENNLYGDKTLSHIPSVAFDYEEGIDQELLLNTIPKFKAIQDLEDGTLFLIVRKGALNKGILAKKDDKKITVLNKSEMKGKFIYSNDRVYVGTTENSEDEVLKTKFKADEGKTFDKEPKFMVAGLMNETGSAQKIATIDEVVEFFKTAQPVYELDENKKPVIVDGKPVKIGERPSVNFKKDNVVITENTVEVKGQLFTKADWAKIKGTANANPNVPYKMTILYGDNRFDKACKLVITQDGYATIESLSKSPVKPEEKDDILEQPLNKDQREEAKKAKEADEEIVYFEDCGPGAIDEKAKFFIINSNGNINVYERKVNTLEPVGALKDIVSDDDDKTLITLEDIALLPTDFEEKDEEGNKLEIEERYGIKIANKAPENIVKVNSSAFDYITLDDLLMFLNEESILGEKFFFELTKAGVMIKDEYIIEYIEDEEKVSNIFFKEKDEDGNPKGIEGALSEDTFNFCRVEYDTNLHIPFKTSDNFARQLAQHCTVTSIKTGDTNGIIGVKPMTNTDLASVAERVKKLLATDYDLLAKKDDGRVVLNNVTGEPFSIGDKVSIVVGQYPVVTNYGFATVSNGAGGYAGMVSALPLDRSSTNQPIGIEVLSYELSNYQLSNLTGKGYVTFKDSYSKGIVVTDGITAAPVNSPLRRLSSVKILKAVKDIIRRKSEPFIGLRNNLFNRASLETAIESDLSKLKGVLLEDYTFHIDSTKSGAKLGILDIFFTIIPYNEIRNINSKIKIVDEIEEANRK